MHRSSWNHWLTTFEIGERRYMDVDIEDYAHHMRTMCAPKSRRPDAIRDWEFQAQMFTAVGAQKLGEVRYLICVERIS